MGTRSLSSIKIGGIFHTQYTQFDGYMGGRGVDFTKFVQKAVVYLGYLKAEHPEKFIPTGAEIAKSYLWMESLESGHGWRGEDEKGHIWSYQEAATLKVGDLADWIQFIRVADFDAGTLSFYGDTLDAVILTIKLSDLKALEHSGLDTLYKVFAYLDDREERTAPVKLEIKSGKRNPYQTHSFAKKSDPGSMREYSTMKLDGKIIYASMFASQTDQAKALDNATRLFEKVEEVEA